LKFGGSAEFGALDPTVADALQGLLAPMKSGTTTEWWPGQLTPAWISIRRRVPLEYRAHSTLLQ
jgi:hypothetical protein